MITFDASRLHDFKYYAANALKILHKEMRTYEPFSDWYEAQEIVWREIKKDLDARRPVRKIILKARQEGISTLTEAIAFHQLHTVPNTRALIISQDDKSSRAVFELSRNFYENLPPGIRPMKRYLSKKEMRFENPDEKERYLKPGLKSSIEIETAGKWEPSRGDMFHFVHFSEVAFWPEGTGARLTAAVKPKVPMFPGTFIIYESTANGLNNDFYDDWLAAKEGEGGFDPIFIPWFKLHEYSMNFRYERDKKDFQHSLDDEEKDYRRRFKLTLEQLNWRRAKIKEMGDDELFKQEYPATDREAFIFHNPTIFDKTALRQIEPEEPKYIADISIERQGLTINEDGLLDVWEDPQSKAEYVIGVDVSSGEGEDYSCAQVLKRMWPYKMADQVAEWHGKVDPVYLGKLVVILARHYNDALLSIEINNHGFTTQVEAKNFYWNLYRWQYLDRMGANKATDKIGWQTNISTKPMMVDRARECIKEGLVGIKSEGLLDELWKYVRIVGTVSYEAERGHDDRVMAFMISLITMYTTQDGLDYDNMLVRPKSREVVIPDLPRQGDPLMLGRPSLIDPGDPRAMPVVTATFANL